MKLFPSMEASQVAHPATTLSDRQLFAITCEAGSGSRLPSPILGVLVSASPEFRYAKKMQQHLCTC